MRLRIKDFTTKVGSGVTPRGGASVYQDQGIPLFRSQNVTNEGFLLDDIVYIPKEIHESMSGSCLKPNDVLLNITGASIGRCFYLPDDFQNGNVNQHVCIIRLKKNVLPAFLYYNLISAKGQSLIESCQTGANREGLAKEDICNFEFDIPSIEQQQKVVGYLNCKTSDISRQVSLLTRKRDAYLRLKKSIINHAVTKGLNPNAKMKDSGIEWIGDVPEDWRLCLLKDCLAIQNGRDYKDIECTDGYPVIGSGGTFAYASNYMYDGEVIFMGRKGTIDRPLYFNGKFWAVDTMFYAIPRTKMVGRYLYYYSLCFPFSKIMTQTALPSMTMTTLNFLQLAVPSTAEQRSIATYLDDKCGKIDAIVANLNKQISRYGDLKRSLIDEVITGKRTV